LNAIKNKKGKGIIVIEENVQVVDDDDERGGRI